MSEQCVLERARVLAGLRSACETADQELTEAEEKARVLWGEYWQVRGDFRIGDVIQHPSLRGSGEWVITEVESFPRGVVSFIVREMKEGVQKGWRRVGRDGLLRVVRRPE